MRVDAGWVCTGLQAGCVELQVGGARGCWRRVAGGVRRVAGLLGEAHGPGGGPHDEDAIPTGGEGEATQGLSGGGGEP